MGSNAAAGVPFGSALGGVPVEQTFRERAKKRRLFLNFRTTAARTVEAQLSFRTDLAFKIARIIKIAMFENAQLQPIFLTCLRGNVAEVSFPLINDPKPENRNPKPISLFHMTLDELQQHAAEAQERLEQLRGYL